MQRFLYAIPMGLTLMLAGCISFPKGLSPGHERDLSLSVFSIGTNQILNEDAGHWGTAFLLDESGTVVTANHVVQDLQAVNVARQAQLTRGKACISITVFDLKTNTSWSIPMDVVAQYNDADLAILRPSNSDWGRLAPPRWRPLLLDERESIPASENVAVVGYPNVAPFMPNETSSLSTLDIPTIAFMQKIFPIVTNSSVSGYTHTIEHKLDTNGRVGEITKPFLLLDHPAAPGNSGGPAISRMTGRVVGVVVRSGPNGYAYAVKASVLKVVLDRYYAARHH